MFISYFSLKFDMFAELKQALKKDTKSLRQQDNVSYPLQRYSSRFLPMVRAATPRLGFQSLPTILGPKAGL